MNSFIETDDVTLFPGTVGYPLGFIFSACSSAPSNDGSIPFGTTIASATVEVWRPTGPAVAGMVGPVVVAGGLIVNTDLTYPAGDNPPLGDYKLRVDLTLSTGAVLVKEWDGLRVEP